MSRSEIISHRRRYVSRQSPRKTACAAGSVVLPAQTARRRTHKDASLSLTHLPVAVTPRMEEVEMDPRFFCLRIGRGVVAAVALSAAVAGAAGAQSGAVVAYASV